MSLKISTSSWHMLRGFEPMSMCDWPGRISCVLFFGGCNLRCPTCHNSRLAWYPGAVKPMDAKQVLKTVSARLNWLDGIVLTGGEVTILSGFLHILDDLRAIDLDLKMDTNGMRPQVVKQVLNENLADMIAVDIKGPWDKYPALTGGRVGSGEARKRLETVFDMASTRPEKFYFRCTKVPALSETDLELVAAYTPPGQQVHFQDYIPPGADNEESINKADSVNVQEEECLSR
ncbi:MAG: anaerobic ribonucleoside-triphosphate reductase activating protein [Thermodesulfobacteriota bacterium]